MSASDSAFRSKSSPRMPDGSRSSYAQDMSDSSQKFKSEVSQSTSPGRHTSFLQTDYFPGSNVALRQTAGSHIVPRQSVYQSSSAQDVPTSAGLQQSNTDTTSAMLHSMPYDYYGNSAQAFAASAGPSSAQWPSFASNVHLPDYARSSHTLMPHQGHFGSEVITGIPSAQLLYESPSSTHASPIGTSSFYDMSSRPYTQTSHPHYAFQEAVNTSDGSMPSHYSAMSATQLQGPDVEDMLDQVSNLYKNASTKKMAEFYRDKWARMWLTCNYTLKPSIQISIPRTILHESYRQACESFSVEPLQAASFGKVLRSQFPDVAQRRLGGRGKTRFHYCGFGTSTEREAIKVKSLLEDEKAGRLRSSGGSSSEFSADAKSKAKSEGHDPSSSSYSSLMYDDAHASRTFSFASSSSQSSNSHYLQARDAPASAFATLTSSASTPSADSAGNHTSFSSHFNLQQQQQLQGLSGQSGSVPRRHTVSHAQSYPELPDMSFLNDMQFHPYPGVAGTGMSTAVETGDNSEGQQSSLASQLNSPASSLLGYAHGYSSQSPHQMRAQGSDWPHVDDKGHTNKTSESGLTLSPNAPKAWPDHLRLE